MDKSKRLHQLQATSLSPPPALPPAAPWLLSSEHLVDDSLDCPLCNAVFRRPTLLPCGHTLCLSCVSGMLFVGKVVGESVACPVCRHDFPLPTGGAESLPVNVYVDTVIEMRKIRRNVTGVSSVSSTGVGGQSHDVPAAATASASGVTGTAARRPTGVRHESALETADEDPQPDQSPTCLKPSTVGCGCGPEDIVTTSPRSADGHDADSPRRKRKYQRALQTAAPASTVSATESTAWMMTQNSEVNEPKPEMLLSTDPPSQSAASQQLMLASRPTENCAQHPNMLIKVYCWECDEPSCETCFIQRHNGHRYADVVDAAQQFLEQLNVDADRARALLADCVDRQRHLDDVKQKLDDSIRSTETAISDDAAALRRLVDDEAAALRHQLATVRNERSAELRLHRDDLESQTTTMESFIEHCESIRNTRAPVDMIRCFKNIHRTAAELPVTGVSAAVMQQLATVSRIEYQASEFRKYLPLNVTNLVGSLHLNDASAEAGEPQSPRPSGQFSSGDEPRSWTDLFDRLKKLEEEMSYIVRESTVSISNLQRQLAAADEREKELQRQLRQAERVLDRFQRAGMKATVVSSFKVCMSTSTVRGIALLDDSVYILRISNNKSTDIAVYEAAGKTLQRRLSVANLGIGEDIVACRRRRVLYVSDSSNDCVHRVDRDGNSINWPVDEKPSGLSVAASTGNVIVTCVVCTKLKEFSAVGRLVRQFSLQTDLAFPWHSLEISGGDKFVVCHGNATETLHRVCIVSATDGLAQAVYGGAKGSTSGLLSSPVHLALADDGFIFVLDFDNRRVVLLDPELIYVSDVITAGVDGDELKDPRRLHWDGESRRLYVAEAAGRVLVYELVI